MIGIILAVVGPLLLGGGVIASIAGPATTLAMGRRAVGAVSGALRGISPRGWKIIGCVAALVVGFIWHQHHAAAQLKAAYAQGKADENARLAAKAVALKRSIDDLGVKITTRLKDQSDEENRRTFAAADDLRLRGPGKAACSAVAGDAALSWGHQPTGGAGDAAVAKVPYPEWSSLIAMPFAGTVAFAEQHDLNRTEVLNCRAAWTQLDAAWRAFEAKQGTIK